MRTSFSKQESIVVIAEQDLIACVDLGSNSFRLQICRNANGALQVVDSVKETVRMAAGFDANKNLSEASRKKALHCLMRFGERLRGFSPERVRAVATNSFRVMNNVSPFLRDAEAALGFAIDIIAGREEARLIYTGVLHSLPFENRQALIVDIGGGSTEFVIGKTARPVAAESLPLGCVAYSVRFFPDGVVNEHNFQAAINTARAEIQRISGSLKQVGWDFAIGTSGTARTIRNIVSTRFGSDKITREHIDLLGKELIAAGRADNTHWQGLTDDRVEILAGGLSVLTAVFAELSLNETIVTDAALRDGVFYDLIGRTPDHDLRDETVVEFQRRYSIDTIQAKRVKNIALHYWHILSTQLTQSDSEYWQHYLEWAANLHEIGLSIAYTAYHKHSAYILNHADMPGFSRQAQRRLAMLVLSHRGDLKKIQDMVENKPQQYLPIMALRLATLFCRGRQDFRLPEKNSLHFDLHKMHCDLSIDRQWLADNPLTAQTLVLETDAWQKIGVAFQIHLLA